jgi:hypothetical protein
VETWTLYVAAPVAAVQLSVTGTVIPVALVAIHDDTSVVGTPGAVGIVVKFHGPAQPFVPLEFIALTSQ